MKPEFGIINMRSVDEFTVVEIDTKQAKYRGISWKTLGDYGKRKFENLLVLTRAKERVKVLYV